MPYAADGHPHWQQRRCDEAASWDVLCSSQVRLTCFIRRWGGAGSGCGGSWAAGDCACCCTLACWKGDERWSGCGSACPLLLDGVPALSLAGIGACVLIAARLSRLSWTSKSLASLKI